MNNGCKGCCNRYVGCHSRCETYKEFSEELMEKKKKIKQAKAVENEYNKYKKNKIAKERKWHR